MIGELIMGYKIVDVIDKAVNIDEKILVLINKVEESDKFDTKIEIMSKVLKKQFVSKIQGYKEIRKEAEMINMDDIDFFVYDKMSFLINEFNKQENKLDIKDIKSYVNSLIDIEKDELALFVDIKGRLVNSEYGYSKENYDTIIKIIDNIDNFISNLESVIN